MAASDRGPDAFSEEARMGVWLLCAIAVVVALIWISAMVGVGSTDIDKQPQRYVDDQQGFGLWWGLANVVGLALSSLGWSA